MAAPDHLVNSLGDQVIAQARFPEAMDWPLVAAALVPAGGDSFLATAVNVMRLADTGYRALHAEEVLFEEHEAATEGDASAEGEVDVLITEEPCRDRQGAGPAATPCCQRVVRFAQGRPLRRVVAGVFATGKGLRFMALEGIRVVLLHGPEHAQLVEEVRGRRIDVEARVAQINGECAARGGSQVELRSVPRLDRLNAEGLSRYRLARRERDAERDRILDWLERASTRPDADLTDGLLTEFPRFFAAGLRRILEENLPRWQGEAGEGMDRRKALAFVENRVYVVWCRERATRIMEELRARGDG